jgi:hypothetical protein
VTTVGSQELIWLVLEDVLGEIWYLAQGDLPLGPDGGPRGSCRCHYHLGTHRDPSEVPVTAVPVVMAAEASPALRALLSGRRQDGYRLPARAISNIAMAVSPTPLLALGDIQYGSGRGHAEYEASFDRIWGRLRSVLYTVPRGQEWKAEGRSGYVLLPLRLGGWPAGRRILLP